jgi:hypothetical protein
MVALVRTLCRLHFTQQRIHLIERQQAVRTDRMVAGHGGQQFIARRFDAAALTGL